MSYDVILKKLKNDIKFRIFFHFKIQIQITIFIIQLRNYILFFNKKRKTLKNVLEHIKFVLSYTKLQITADQ
jgi:hypothetical protein